MTSKFLAPRQPVTQRVAPPQIKPSPGLISTAVLALSMVAHGLLLQTPLPQSPESAPSSSAPPAADLSVVVIPQFTGPEPRPLVPTQRAPQPEPEPQTATPLPAPPLARPQLAPAPPPPVLAPTAAPSAPSGELPSAGAEPPPMAAEPPIAPTPSPPASTGPLGSYGDRFPHVAGAIAGCWGLANCRRVSDVSSYRTVARSLIAGLADQGYEVDWRDDLEDAGRHVYELTPPEGAAASQYLLVFSALDGSAIYVLSDAIMTLSELQSLSAQTAGTPQRE